MDYKRLFYEYSCWADSRAENSLGNRPAHEIGFYEFLREVKEISVRRLNLDGVVNDDSAEAMV